MVSLKKILNDVVLTSALILSSGAVSSAEREFPLELGHYEYKAVYCKDIEKANGLEKKLLGNISMDVGKTESGYSVDIYAEATPWFGLLKFSNTSHFEISDSYRSLINSLETYFQFAIFPKKQLSKYFFEEEDGSAILRINNSSFDEEMRFNLSADTYGPLAAFARFFSGNHYKEGDHYIGRMKGDGKKEAKKVFVNVKRNGDVYSAKSIIPESVFQEAPVPLTVYYTKGEDGANIFRVDVVLEKINKCISAIPAWD